MTLEHVLSPKEIVDLNKLPNRPQLQDYLELIFSETRELHGDRTSGDDSTMYAGLARLPRPEKAGAPYPRSLRCAIVGQRKGHTTAERIQYEFGSAHAEGYRKAMRVMKMAEKYRLPVITFIDTPGAAVSAPGVGITGGEMNAAKYEDMGRSIAAISESIATNLREMSRLRTPIVSVILGEGGSGGALGIAVADRIAMMEYAWYSVISPEGCSGILWKDRGHVCEAAEALCLTAQGVKSLGIVDTIIPEVAGGTRLEQGEKGSYVAKGDVEVVAISLRTWLYKNIWELQESVRRQDISYEKNPTVGSGFDQLVSHRYERLKSIGVFGKASSERMLAYEKIRRQPGYSWRMLVKANPKILPSRKQAED